MDKHNFVWPCLAIIALGVLCGCETVTIPPEPPTPVKTDYATIYDLERLALNMMEKLNVAYIFIRSI